MLSKITNLIGWVGVALVFGALALRFLRPADMSLWWNLAAAGLVCVLIYVIGQWREFVTFFSRRSTRYGTFSVVSVIVVLAILVGLNYIATRQNKRWDLTSNQQFTLSEQTTKILKGLKEPLTMIAFERTEGMAPYRDRLQDYASASSQVKTDFIDPDKEPLVARKYEIPAYGTIVIEHKNRIERVTGQGEQELTNAIIKVTSDSQKKIYFVQGHGEHDTASADEQRGYSVINTSLARENFTIDKLVLVQNPTVPDDAAVVVVAGPQSDYLTPEIDALRAYLNKGGKVLFMVDPPDVVDAKPLTNLIALIKEWGIEVGDNVVIDRSGIGQIVGRGSGHADRHRLSGASDHRSLQQHHDGLPARAFGHAFGRRAVGTDGADDRRDEQGELGGKRREGAGRTASGRLRRSERRQTGADFPRGRDRHRRARSAAGAGARHERRRARSEADARGRLRRLRLPRERQSRGAGQRESVLEYGQLARAAGQPDLDPSEAARRSARHVDAGTALVGDAVLGHLPARCGRGDGLLHVVEATLTCSVDAIC